VPLVSPETIIGLALPVATMPPGVEVTVYPLFTSVPPFRFGAVKATDTCWLPLVPTTAVGAPGNAVGMLTLLETPDGTPVPIALVAVTWKV